MPNHEELPADSPAELTNSQPVAPAAPAATAPTPSEKIEWPLWRRIGFRFLFVYFIASMSR